MNRMLILAALLAAATACDSVESDDVLTDGIYVNYDAVNTGGATTEATAVFRVGGAASNTFVNLGGDDSVTVSVDGDEPTALSETNLGDLYSYVGTFQATAEDSSFAFALNRSIDEGAPASDCSLPAPLSLQTPADGATFSRPNDPIPVTWDNSGQADDLEVVLESDCIVTSVNAVSGDPGTFVIEAGSYTVFEDRQDEQCEATIKVRRIRTGTLDAGFGEGGRIACTQERTVSIRLDP